MQTIAVGTSSSRSSMKSSASSRLSNLNITITTTFSPVPPDRQSLLDESPESHLPLRPAFSLQRDKPSRAFRVANVAVQLVSCVGLLERIANRGHRGLRRLRRGGEDCSLRWPRCEDEKGPPKRALSDFA